MAQQILKIDVWRIYIDIYEIYEDFFVFLISRYGRERMGLTEAEAVGKMWSGVKAMIQVGQPAHVPTDASSDRVMKQKLQTIS